MALVTLQNTTKTYGPKVVLENVTLDIQRGDKAGLIGANGAGKTTVFRLITGDVRPDYGTVTKSRGLKVGYLPQEPELEATATLIDEVAGVFEGLRLLEIRMHQLAEDMTHHHDSHELDGIMAEYDTVRARFEAGGGYGYATRINEVLGGLGFSPQDEALPVSALSGGQKCRASLAKLLLQDTDLLLLDEPTNHLDIDATRWLEKWLAGYMGSVVIVSHDRYLLDRVVGKIIEVEDRGVTVYGCNYSHYAEAKRTRLLQAVREYTRQQEWLKHQREFIARTKARKDTAKQARGRQWYIERMERDGKVLERPQALRDKMKLEFNPADRGGDMIFRCEGVSKRYDHRVLLEDFNLEVTRGQKVGIMGPNGSGKTTLLKMALGQVRPDAGDVRLFENLTIGYYDQEHEALNLDGMLIEEVRALRPECSEQQVRSYLASFLFFGDDVFKTIGNLSGGEQSRVLLAMLVWMAPHVLVLDEPTNHLDIPSKEVLEEALRNYEGTILLVSHDRYLLDQVVDRLIVVHGDGRSDIHPGNYTDYVRRQDEIAAEQAAAEAEAAAQSRQGAKRGQRRSRSARKSAAVVDSPWARKSLDDLEAVIMETEERIAALERQFENEAVYRDAERARGLRDEYNRLRGDLEEMLRVWESHAG
ncbi:MAG: ABC-F family ATP-binding cassette domain-containing protein [Phycisphaerae bacterium]|nr:ABC-F family ATP-binding cassette domain-containing protein [Phycisphaerae bacterium]